MKVLVTVGQTNQMQDCKASEKLLQLNQIHPFYCPRAFIMMDLLSGSPSTHAHPGTAWVDGEASGCGSQAWPDWTGTCTTCKQYFQLRCLTSTRQAQMFSLVVQKWKQKVCYLKETYTKSNRRSESGVGWGTGYSLPPSSRPGSGSCMVPFSCCPADCMPALPWQATV